MSIKTVYRQFAEERFPLPSEEEVTELEGRIGVKLPQEYRDFILQYNGGVFRGHFFEPPNEELRNYPIQAFYGIGASYNMAELGKRSDMVLFDENDPPQILIIANTTNNHLIVLGVDPENYGEYFFRTFSDWHFLTDSLQELFSFIVEKREE